MGNYQAIIVVEGTHPIQLISNRNYLRYNYIAEDKIKIFFLNSLNKEACVTSDLKILSNRKQIKTLNRWDFEKDTFPHAPHS